MSDLIGKRGVIATEKGPLAGTIIEQKRGGSWRLGSMTSLTAGKS
jgi:hypothetical protein